MPASYRGKAAHPRLSFKGGALQALDRAPASASAAFLRHTNQKSGKRESSAFPLFPESKILRMPLQALVYGNFLCYNYDSRIFEGGQRIGQPGITGTNREVEQTALQFANRCGKFFFYTESSIYDLEQILQGYHEDLRSEKPTENQLWSMASIWGAYLGETMLRNGLRDKGFEWAVADGSPIPVLRNGPAVITPIDKVYKRFVNGREDNVVSLLYSYASDCTDGPIVIR